MVQNVNPVTGCGCGAEPAAQPPDAASGVPESAPDLAALIPIAVVIAAGCEPCAVRMVRRALDAGASARQVRKTVALVDHLHRQQCFADSVGPRVIARMERPLAAARETLSRTAARAR